MKQAVIQKSAESAPATAEQLEKINRYTRRDLNADEVHVFSLVLCDNEVDRDYERFPTESLQKLAELYLGKTGIFDHNPKGENQTARIFETALERDESRTTQAGEPYCALRAWAYMVRCEKNADLILEIDAGIKKEVSVGCAVEQTECSVCGADTRRNPCAHEAGQKYGGELCYRSLINPTDAYEWSFVAVPAQKQAGVTKGLVSPDGELLKSLEQGSVTLSKAQANELAKQFRELSALAEEGRRRVRELRRGFVAAGAFALPGVDAEVLGQVAEKLDAGQLKALCKGMRKKLSPLLQLGGEADSEKPDNGAFLI